MEGHTGGKKASYKMASSMQPSEHEVNSFVNMLKRRARLSSVISWRRNLWEKKRLETRTSWCCTLRGRKMEVIYFSYLRGTKRCTKFIIHEPSCIREKCWDVQVFKKKGGNILNIFWNIKLNLKRIRKQEIQVSKLHCQAEFLKSSNKHSIQAGIINKHKWIQYGNLKQ